MAGNAAAARVTDRSSEISRFGLFVEQHSSWLVACGLLSYLLDMLLQARRSPYEPDELLVYAQSRLSFSAFWDTLRHVPTVLDPPIHPVLMFFTLHTSMPARLALRLPSVLAYAIVLICVFAIVSRRASASIALLTFAVAATIPAAIYSIQARPYALLLAFVALTLLMYQRVTDAEKARAWSLIVFAAFIAATICTHYFGIFVLLPLIAGEVTRAIARKEPDWPLYLALAFGCSSAAIYALFATAAAPYRIHPWHGVLADDLRATYLFVSEPLIFLLLMTVPLNRLFRPSTPSSDWQSPAAATFHFPSHEVSAIGVLLFVPVCAFVFAKLVTHSYVARYGIIFVIGAAILLGVALSILGGNSRSLNCAVTILLLLPLLHAFEANLRSPAGDPDEINPASLKILERYPDLSIAVSDWQFGSRLFLFGTASTKRRVVLIDREDLTMRAIQRALRMPIQTYRPFLASHAAFLLVAKGWKFPQVQDEAARITLLGTIFEGDILLVEMPPHASTSGR